MELYTPPRKLGLTGFVPYQSPYEPSFFDLPEAFPGKNFCTWGIFEVVEDADDGLIDRLRAEGWEPWSDNWEIFSFLQNQLAQTLIIQEKGGLMRYWARSDEINFATSYPVLLTSRSTDKNPLDSLSPEREHGSCALIDDKTAIRLYTIDQLGEEGARLSERIRAGMLVVPASKSLPQQEVRQLAERRRSLWEQTHHAAQQLARMYWGVYQRELGSGSESEERQHPAPTATHRTRLPLTNAFEGLVQSFGPGVQQADWSRKHLSGALELTTPNGSRLLVEGENELERAALDNYVGKMLGPEGLKHVLALLDIYALQTGGRDREVDAKINIRQLLIRLGKGKKADTRAEQSKLIHTMLYLARTTIRSHEFTDETGARPQSFTRQQDLLRKPKRYAPLLVLKRVAFGPDGLLLIPKEVEFHIGKGFFEALFGARPTFYLIPTAQFLKYHAVRQQQELLLALYLCNRLALSGGHFYVPCYSLLLQSSLLTRESIRHGHDRTRSVERILLALESLARDGLIRRAPHEHVDTVLLTGLEAGDRTSAVRAPIQDQPGRLQAQHDKIPFEKRLAAIRLLLDEHASAYPLQFSFGPALRKRPTLQEAAQTGGLPGIPPELQQT